MPPDKQQVILDAAQAQFLRYGFRRVTMADIAGAAGMSRPSLYLLFPNKEGIFSGVFARYIDASLAEIEQGLNEIRTEQARLAFAVEIWTIRPYELLHGTPEGRELVECKFNFAAEIIRDRDERFEAIIKTILSPPLSKQKHKAKTTTALAQVFTLSLLGIRAGARDVTHLRELVTHLITHTTPALGEATDLARVNPATAGAT